jgi:hypothetical protein
MHAEEGARHDEAMSGDIAERVRSIVAAAEETAGAIRSDAEKQAAARLRELEDSTKGYVAEARARVEAHAKERSARITEISERLTAEAEDLLKHVRNADQLRRQLEEAQIALGQAAERMNREASRGWRDFGAKSIAAAAQPTEEPAPQPAEPQPVAEERSRRFQRLGRHRQEQPAPGGQASGDKRVDIARLIALQMAVAGSERPEVEEHLRSSFDLDDPAPVLDAVFGELEAEQRRA